MRCVKVPGTRTTLSRPVSTSDTTTHLVGLKKPSEPRQDILCIDRDSIRVPPVYVRRICVLLRPSCFAHFITASVSYWEWW